MDISRKEFDGLMKRVDDIYYAFEEIGGELNELDEKLDAIEDTSSSEYEDTIKEINVLEAELTEEEAKLMEIAKTLKVKVEAFEFFLNSIATNRWEIYCKIMEGKK